ncbi:conserved exported hypothetical protein [Rubrivivax sp. A210]|uniref:hypothetical protein n=1 Tax=Rubrivivax sp. A210 TaxID=2772301 RepID=UPI00191A50A1|nr:hypothetical protein [Rubrivivax sp. A210]CAD5374296.1 conserved exported hypothetical protein [Rubrivivax sp. A210]
MKSLIALCALVLATSASAADPKTRLLDFSQQALIGHEAATALMAEQIPAKVWKLYPASKWAFVSQVEGGLTAAGICAVTARVMLLPLTPTLKVVTLRPAKTATAFDAQPGATMEACKALARDKLKEATGAVVSALVKV